MNLGRPNKNWTSLTLCAPDSSHQSISFMPASNYFGHKIPFFFRERNAASFMLHTRCCHSKRNKNLRWPMRWLVVVFLGHQWLKRAPSFPCIWCNKKKKKQSGFSIFFCAGHVWNGVFLSSVWVRKCLASLLRVQLTWNVWLSAAFSLPRASVFVGW